MKDVDISVVMCVHNGDIAALRKSVDSILNQSKKNFEFIIVNDRNSFEVDHYLNQIKIDNDNVKLIQNKSNIGLTKSLIKAISIAKGKYIARQDSDDISRIDRLEIQYKHLISNDKIVLLGSAYKIDYGGVEQKNIIPPLKHNEIVQAFLLQNPFAHTSVIFKKDIYLKIGGYNKDCKYSQDFDLWPKFIKYGFLENLSDILVTRNLNNDSISLRYFVNIYQTFIGMKVRFRERKLFKDKLIMFKIILIGLKQHISFYLNFLKFKK